jgi:hydrogenase maturation protein HypF
MADNGLENRRLIGLAFDGTGYGTDGAIWGGEALVASYSGFERLAHLEYLPLPGGDTAYRAPWSVACGYAHTLGLVLDDLPFLRNIDPSLVQGIRQQLDESINAPLTSSMGRLFDAVASLIGVRNDTTYEAQAAIEMEVLARPFISSVTAYPFTIEVRGNETVITVKDLLATVISDVRLQKSSEMIAARFHRTVAEMAVELCRQARQSTGLDEVALSGGVWQNRILLDLVRSGLKQDGFAVYFHQQVPTNDGGLALGQAAIANYSK